MSKSFYFEQINDLIRVFLERTRNVQSDMAESNEKSFFSTLLQRLFDGDYSCRSIRRHGTIREQSEQIQVLLKSEKVSELE